jgi:hypothetical protein
LNEQVVDEYVYAHLSHYTPWTGGTNCFRFVNGECISPMANSEDWRKYIGKATACPVEYPFETVFILPGKERFICKDRGGKIVTESDGTIWLDLLVESPPVPYGALVRVGVFYP